MSFKNNTVKLIEFDDEDDAFANILTQIYKSKNEAELKSMVKYIFAYDEQYNNKLDLDYFIDVWDKRYKDLKLN